MISIRTPEGTIIQVKNIKQISQIEVDKNGVSKSTEFVQYIQIGRKREWKNFMAKSVFGVLNPNIKLE